jgi:hypothetical protein
VVHGQAGYDDVERVVRVGQVLGRGDGERAVGGRVVSGVVDDRFRGVDAGDASAVADHRRDAAGEKAGAAANIEHFVARFGTGPGNHPVEHRDRKPPNHTVEDSSYRRARRISPPLDS